MYDYKMNYDKLRRIHIFKIHIFVYFIIICLIFLLYIACQTSIERKISCYGIFNNELLTIQINEELSDKLKSSGKLVFKGRKMNYRIVRYGDYQIINNQVVQNIELIVDKYIYDKEVGKLDIIYDRQKIIKYILELFK